MSFSSQRAWSCFRPWPAVRRRRPCNSHRARASAPAVAPERALVDKYCVTCHNQRAKTGGLTLDTLDLSDPASGAEVWEKVIRKVRGGLMPPVGMPRPDKAALAGLAVVPRNVDRQGGGGASRRRDGPCFIASIAAEYGNAIRDLLALDVDVTSLLPPDDEAYGFDNIARRPGRVAGADGALPLGGVEDQQPGGRRSEDHGRRRKRSASAAICRRTITSRACRSARAAASCIRYTFPVDGEYVISPKLYRETVNIIRGLERAHDLEITFDGERVLLARFGGDERRAGELPQPDRGRRRAREALSDARCA